MRKLLILLASVILPLSPLFAQSSGQQAQAIVNAVKAGEDITSFGLPDATQSEIEWLSSLKDCEVKLSPISTKSYISLIWQCDEKAQSNMTRVSSGVVTSMIFSDDMMREFWIDLTSTAFKQLTSDASIDGLLSPKDTAKDFYEAVNNGFDPTLNGAIPINEGQVRRLKLYQGCRAKRMSGSTNTRQHYLWRCRNRKLSFDLITIGFDSEQRPLGIEFGFVTRRPES